MKKPERNPAIGEPSLDGRGGGKHALGVQIKPLPEGLPEGYHNWVIDPYLKAIITIDSLRVVHCV